ncbi:hypothetical protein N0V93_010334 [Gnomoniopsis smithogilvyi]|uniref:Uncharacterized protein n=1 Tax=Gnomoniopsis smithogilvyi TaxID=1191159 RepID=A0A9W8YIJ9_9PEZI|nr:hypothetical protein N0V93_010334 [Gnomoniopsis smithogilvyi]
MERRKRKAIASLLETSQLHRLPKFGAKLSSLVGSQTASRTNTEKLYQGQDDKRCSRLDFTSEGLGGSGLNIDLRSLEAFRDADNSWFGHDSAAQGGGKQGQTNNKKSSTPIADQFSKAKGDKGNIAAPQVNKALLPSRPQARPELPGFSNGRNGKQPHVSEKSNETASIECISNPASGRSVSVLERQRGVKPRLCGKERPDPSIEPIRIKLATTSQPADHLQMPPSRETTRETRAARASQQASTFSYQDRFVSDKAKNTPSTVTSGPTLSGVSVQAHIQRCRQHHNQIADSSESARKRQSMPASMPDSPADRSTLRVVETGRDSHRSISKAAGLPKHLQLIGTGAMTHPSEHQRFTWCVSPTSSACIVPGHDVRRHASTRASAGNRLAWIKELEERKESNLGLKRELPVLKKTQGSVADKLAKFERLAQQPDEVTTLQRVTWTRSNSISSQRSFLTSAGSRPASWYQSGSTIATTARTSTDSHRPSSVLLNYNETFLEKMQIVAGKHNKQDQEQDEDRDPDRKSEDSQALQKGPIKSGESNEGNSGLVRNQSHKAEAAKRLNASDEIQTTIPSSKLDSIDQSKPPAAPCLVPAREQDGKMKPLKI